MSNSLDFPPADVEMLAVGIAELRKLEAQPSPADAGKALEAAADAAFNPRVHALSEPIREARRRLGYGDWQPQPAGD